MASLPPGFEVETQPAPIYRRRSGMAFRGASIPAGTIPHDGDTLPVAPGTNGRLFGVDAFELNQPGFQGGQTVNLGSQARSALTSQLVNGATATPTGDTTYNRPVVSLDANGSDPARALVSQGMALPEPRYLSADPARMKDYISAQDAAIAGERGAYAGQYQRPSDYRHIGPTAPIAGKLPLTPQQQADYADLVKRPGAKPSDLEAWYGQQGNPAANVPNIFQYQRRANAVTPPAYFQQRDALGAPVQANGPSLPSRLLNQVNEGALSVLSTPGDLIAGVGNALGLKLPYASPGAHMLAGKIGAVAPEGDAAWAPRSTAERYAQSIANAGGQAALPFLGTLGAGMKVAAGGAAVADGSAGSILKGMARDVVESPKTALIGEAGGAVGQGVGGQAARDAFPDNPYADTLGQVLGGLGGGFGAGSLAPHRADVPGAEPVKGDVTAPVPVGAADYLPAIKAPEGVPQFASDGAPLVGMVDDGTGRMVPQYGMPNQPGARGNSEATPSAPSAGGQPGANAPQVANMAADIPEGFEIEGPQVPDVAQPRAVDRIDVGHPDLPPGFQFEQPMQIGRPYPMGQRPTPEQMASTVRSMQPDDVLPIPSNEVGSVDEAASIGAGMRPEAQAPDERSVLPPYMLPGQSRPRRNPLDLASWLRTQGGVADTGGDLAHLGITNKPRDMDFARDEGFLGPLVSPNGMSLDEAARAAHEAGYFPDHFERPTPNDLIDALDATHRGDASRVFHPSDYEAIDNFYKTRDDRHLIEQAQQEGSPLVHDLGQPVDLTDLEANSPPSSAYEDLPPKQGGRVGNINLDKLQSSEDIGRLLTNVRAKFGGFDAARRGSMTHAETAGLARQLGMTPDDLMKRPVGQAMNAEQGHAMASILAKSADEVVKLARSAKGGTDADKAAFWQAAVRHAAIQEQVEGARSEAGRALSAMRMTASSRDVAGRIHKIIGTAGGDDRVEDVAGKILDLANKTGDPGKVSKLVRKSVVPGIGDKLSEIYINSLLSGPQTHAANFISNSLTAALQIPEHAVAAALGSVRGKGDRVLLGEVPVRTFAMLQGTKEGFRAFADTMRTGNVPDHVSKVEQSEVHAIKGVKGSIIRTPTRALSAADELFKGIARRMEINGLALRQAKAEGLSGQALKDRIADLSSNPSDDVVEQSKKYARYLTFQQPLGEVGQAVSRVSQWKPMGLPVGKLIVPFVRTPANLIKFAAERSPAAPLLKSWRDDVAAGGARRDLAAAKALVGSGAGLMFYQMAKDGLITGSGPADDNARALKQADGWQPYSIKVGGKWVSYARLDPLSTTMGVAADLATKGDQMTDAQREEAAGVVTAAIINNLSNKTWLSGVSDLMGVIHDPVRNGGNYARNEAASVVVPGILAQIARGSDPYQRETKTAVDAIRARIPVLSQHVPARLDVWGNPVKRTLLPMGASVVAPFNVSTPANDPVSAALVASGSHISKPSQKVGGITLSPEQYRAYQLEIGKSAYPSVAAIVSKPNWLTMTDEERQDAVSGAMRDVRSGARATLGLDWKKAGGKSSGIPPGFEIVPPGFVLDPSASAKPKPGLFGAKR